MFLSDYVLIYEPDSISAQLLIYGLKESSVPCYYTAHWSEVLERAADPELRILVLHLDEPTPRVLSLLQQVNRNLRLPLPIFVTTSDPAEERIQVMMTAAGVHVLRKPYDIREVLALIQDRYEAEKKEALLFRQIQEKELLLQRLLEFQKRSVLMEEVNREILAARTDDPQSTRQVLVFALDTDLRFLYFTPDFERGFQMMFGRSPALGERLTDLPWPPSFLDIVAGLMDVFDGRTRESEFDFTVGLVRLRERILARPLRLEDGAIFGALIRSLELFAPPTSDAVPDVKLFAHFQPEFANLILMNLKRHYFVCDRDLHILYAHFTRTSSLLPGDLTGSPLEALAAEFPRSLPPEGEESLVRLRWALPDLKPQEYWTTIRPIAASLYPVAAWLVIVHSDLPDDTYQQLWCRALWNQDRLPLAVTDSSGALQQVNEAWRREFPAAPQHAETTSSEWLLQVGPRVRIRRKSWEVLRLPLGQDRSFLAVLIPASEPQRPKRWLDGPEVVSLIAHQWRQPLASIGSILNTLQLQMLQAPPLHENFTRKIAHLQTLVQHLSATIDDFRKLFDPSPHEEDVNVSLLSRAIHDLLAEKLVALDIDWRWELETEDLCVRAGRGLLAQALIELAQNSLTALGNTPPPRVLEWAVRRHPKGVIISLRHNGRPFPPEILHAIRERRKIEHGGLGLNFVCKVIRKKLHGTYRVTQDATSVTQIIRLPGVCRDE